MHNHQNPWRWPLAMSFAAALLWVVVFVIPPAWFAYIFDINQPSNSNHREQDMAWLLLHPPPEVLIEYEPKVELPQKIPAEEPEPFTPQDWWNQSAAVSVVKQDFIQATPISQQDSINYFIKRLGLTEDFMTRTQPDSLLAEKLFFLQLEDSFEFGDAKPYLSALGRAKDYQDIMSRAAAMYDEFLNSTIMVPD